MPIAVYALAAGAFGIGVTEFVIMGLLLEVSGELNVTIAAAGLLISGYALGVTIGAPVLTAMTARWPRKAVLIALMIIFVVGNAACALSPTYSWLMLARILTALTHGTFFGVGSVVATNLADKDKRASAIATMFTGLTVATVIGVPFGTWLGQNFGWRSAFWAVTVVGLVALIILAALVPQDKTAPEGSNWRSELRAVAQPPVLFGLITTVFGYAGIFAVFTYIAPLLTQITRFPNTAISPILLIFGAGLVVGNLLGGKIADRNLPLAILGTLTALSIVLGLMTFAFNYKITAIIFVWILGATGFSTVAPLQMWILSKTKGVGQSLASSFNIGAFNLGNAIGAWTGGLVIDHGPGISWVPIVATVFPVIAIVITIFVLKTGKTSTELKSTFLGSALTTTTNESNCNGIS